MLSTPQPRHTALIVISLLLPLTAAAQQPRCAELQALKKEAYGFRPNELTELQQAAKERQIERFRKLAEAEGERAVRCLRAMLKAETTDSFFLFDGATLLLHLDDSQASLTVVSDAAVRSDLGDINPASYVELALELAQHGVDTAQLAEKYMKFPNVDGYAAEHSLALDRATGAIFLYGSMTSEHADEALVPLLDARGADVRGAAALQLALNMTLQSYRALAGLSGLDDFPDYAQKQLIAALAYHPTESKVIPTYSREQVLARLHTLPRNPAEMEAELKKETPVLGIANDEPLIRSAVATLNVGDLETVRQARRTALISISEESLNEYAAYTRMILGVINRLDLYKEYRVH